MKKDNDPLPAGISLQWASLKKGHLSTACVRTCVPEISSRRGPGGDRTWACRGVVYNLKVSGFLTVLVPAYSLLKHEQLQLAQLAFVTCATYENNQALANADAENPSNVNKQHPSSSRLVVWLQAP